MNNLFPIKLKNPYGKIVVTIHDVFPLYMPQYYGKIYPHYFRYGIRKSIKNADYIIYNSKETKLQTEKYFKQAEKRESFISYIIVDEDENKQEPKITKWEKEDYFLYIGNMEKRKGTDLLLEAFCEYVKNGGKKKLLCAGKMREEKIEEMFKNIEQKTKQVEYLGYIDEDEKRALLRNCSCFIFPSKAEGFGIPIIEAMSYYKPIIASNLSIFQEIAGANINYVNIEAENTILQLVEQMNEYNQRIDVETYKEIVQRYTSKTLGNEIYYFFKRSLRK